MTVRTEPPFDPDPFLNQLSLAHTYTIYVKSVFISCVPLTVKKLLCACHVVVQYMATLNIITSWVFAYRK